MLVHQRVSDTFRSSNILNGRFPNEMELHCWENHLIAVDGELPWITGWYFCFLFFWIWRNWPHIRNRAWRHLCFNSWSARGRMWTQFLDYKQDILRTYKCIVIHAVSYKENDEIITHLHCVIFPYLCLKLCDMIWCLKSESQHIGRFYFASCVLASWREPCELWPCPILWLPWSCWQSAYSPVSPLGRKVLTLIFWLALLHVAFLNSLLGHVRNRDHASPSMKHD